MSTPTSENTSTNNDLSLQTEDSIVATSSVDKRFDIIVTCADGLEAPLQTELDSMAISSELKSTGRIAINATLEQIYKICLWSRVASRVLLPIKKRNINKDYDVAEQLNGLAKTVDWT